jgi:hypothetical protein
VLEGMRLPKSNGMSHGWLFPTSVYWLVGKVGQRLTDSNVFDAAYFCCKN